MFIVTPKKMKYNLSSYFFTSQMILENHFLLCYAMHQQDYILQINLQINVLSEHTNKFINKRIS